MEAFLPWGCCGAIRLDLTNGSAGRGLLDEGSPRGPLLRSAGYHWSEGISSRSRAVCNWVEGASLGIYVWSSEQIKSTFYHTV